MTLLTASIFARSGMIPDAETTCPRNETCCVAMVRVSNSDGIRLSIVNTKAHFANLLY